MAFFTSSASTDEAAGGGIIACRTDSKQSGPHKTRFVYAVLGTCLPSYSQQLHHMQCTKASCAAAPTCTMLAAM